MAERAERGLRAETGVARVALAATIGLAGLAGVAVILQAMLLARVLDAAAFHGAGLAAVAPLLTALGVLFVARTWLSWGAEIMGFRAAARVKAGLRRRLLAHLFALGPVFAAGERSGELAATVLESVEALEPYIARYLPQMVLVGLVPLAILAAVVPLDWRSAAVLVVSGPLIPLFMVLVGSQAEAINRRQWRQLLLMGAHFLDAVQGLTTLKLFGRARAEVALVGKIADEYRRTTMASLRVAFLTSAVLEFFASLSIALVAVLFGTRLMHGHAHFLPALLVLLLVPEFFMPLRGLAVHYHARMSALAAAERIFEVLRTPLPRPRGTLAAPAGTVGLACRDLRVDYATDRPVLRGIDCEMRAGTMTALVGASGAGKSTLAAALLGFVQPSSGAVLVDGVPLAQIMAEEWWRRLAYVPQAPRLFAGTIASNLLLARPEADAAALREAARLAGALDFIEALPDGFATAVGGGGAGFSGGQAQRLALARAFLKDAPVLILDEATSGLDLETEADIVAAMGRLLAGRTSVVIAHRLATTRRADRILVLEAGRVVEQGTHARLAEAGGVYARMLGAYAEGAHAGGVDE
ncbi:MAG: thiol reductant ABC exporter subunit CydD [Acetobacteraceae bacterium]